MNNFEDRLSLFGDKSTCFEKKIVGVERSDTTVALQKTQLTFRPNIGSIN